MCTTDLESVTTADSRMRIVAVCAIVISLIAFPPAARSHATKAADSGATIRVAFLQGEQLAEVRRRGTTPTAAVRALIAGPTSAERSRGYRTYLETGTRLHRLSVNGSLVTVDLSNGFAVGSPDRRAARLAQL